MLYLADRFYVRPGFQVSVIAGFYRHRAMFGRVPLKVNATILRVKVKG